MATGSVGKLKRLRSQDEDREVSPPPLKRHRLPATSSASATQTQTQSQAHDPSSPNLLRIYSWNVNGINTLLPNHTINQKSITTFFSPSPSSPTKPSEPASPTPPPYSLRLILHRLHYPQILCLQEVKISSTDLLTQRAVERAANDSSAITTIPTADQYNYKPFFSLPRDKHNARSSGGKLYGVCTLIRTDFLSSHVQATKEVSWDQEGRVLVTELKPLLPLPSPSIARRAAEEKAKLVVINGYWVNGTMNPYRDPRTGAVIGTRHNRKRAFQRLMRDEVLRYESEGCSVVLIGDMNIARSVVDGWPGIRLGPEHVRNRREFNELFIGPGVEGGSREEKCMRGVDALRWVHGDQARKYTYFPRGAPWGESCDRVDLVVVSRGLVFGRDWQEGKSREESVIVDADTLETEEARGHSDHAPLYVVLDLEKWKKRE